MCALLLVGDGQGVWSLPAGEMEEVSGEVSGGLRLKDEGDGY